MLHQVFYWIFNMSIVVAITGLFVMLVRGIKRIPRRVSVFLWAIPFLRMVLPFGLNSPYSLMTLLSSFTTRTVVVYRLTDKSVISSMNCVMAADSYFPITYKADILEDVFRAASLIWIIVALAILLMLTVIYLTTLREIKTAVLLKDNIYLSEKITSPAVYGIFKPRIILPSSYRDRDIELIVLHEQTHIRSMDNLWRVIAFSITAIHWFNPLAWWFLKNFLADLELSCDERVLTKIGRGRAKEYAFSLLETKQDTIVFASAFGGARIGTRIKNILSFKRMTWFSITVFTVLVGIIFYVLLTNAP